MSMPPERWRFIEQLYLAAVERPPDERAAYLDQACPDPDLRREVESLFEHKGDRLMQHSPLAPSSGLKPGMRLGPYEVESRLGDRGHGGHGRGVSSSADVVVNSNLSHTCGGGGIGRRTSLRCVLRREATGKPLQVAEFPEAGKPRQPSFP